MRASCLEHIFISVVAHIILFRAQCAHARGRARMYVCCVCMRLHTCMRVCMCMCVCVYVRACVRARMCALVFTPNSCEERSGCACVLHMVPEMCIQKIFLYTGVWTHYSGGQVLAPNCARARTVSPPALTNRPPTPMPSPKAPPGGLGKEMLGLLVEGTPLLLVLVCDEEDPTPGLEEGEAASGLDADARGWQKPWLCVPRPPALPSLLPPPSWELSKSAGRPGCNSPAGLPMSSSCRGARSTMIT